MLKVSILNFRYLNLESSYDIYLSYIFYSILLYIGLYFLLFYGYIVGVLFSKRISVLVGYLNFIFFKKLLRLFYLRDNMFFIS